VSTRSLILRSRRAATLAAIVLPVTLCAGLVGVVTAATAATPTVCTQEKTSTGAIDPNGICVSYGYGVKPAGTTGPATRNVLAYAQGTTAMPFDYYARNDVAAADAAGTGRPRAVYMLIHGGGFICGSRQDLASQARELAKRGYIVVVPEYPLSGQLATYGYYNPNAPYTPASVTQKGANPCTSFASWLSTSPWQQNFLPKLKSHGMDPFLQQGRWVLQTLVRALKTNSAYGADPARIWALGESAGGAEAISLALGGNNDRLPSGADPGDSKIAGAISISGPICYPGMTKDTDTMLLGAVSPSQMPACNWNLDGGDARFISIQEPPGGADDPVVPDSMVINGCNAVNAAGYGRKCILEDRPISQGGFLPDGGHADIGWTDYLRLFDVLASQTVGQP
jgi:hypothetical protein